MENSTTSQPTYAQLLAVIERQEGIIARQQEQLEKYETKLSEQRATILRLEGRVAELEKEVKQKDLRIEQLLTQLYGKKSEKGKGSGKGGGRGSSRQGYNDDKERNKKKYPDHLPRVEEVVDNIPAGEDPNDYELIGEDRVSRIATLPAQHYVVVTIHRTYKKKSNSYIPPRKTEHEHPLGKCSAHISFVVFAIIQKILFHVPFYRLEQILKLQKITCYRSNLVRWSERFASILEPIALAILKDIKAAKVIYGDESPSLVRVYKDDKSSEYKDTYFWNLVAPQRGIYFKWTEKRNQKEAEKLLKGYAGIFVSDALGIYEHATQKFRLTWQICWIHIRRKFLNATGNTALSNEALTKVNTILAIDKAIRRRTKEIEKFEKRAYYRQRFLLPLVENMREWISSHIDSPAVQTDKAMLEAFNYIDKRWEEATCFIRNPAVLPHNNIPEQFFRFLKLAAKNWLFCGSEWGAKTLSTLYTLVYSAKLLDINPTIYLLDITEMSSVPGVTAEDLIPRRWKETRERIATEKYFSATSNTTNPK